tara:strand:+ start:2817 stop:3134 length:318 start_codon:yes stop_codon:yes gene_type:complete
MGYMTYGSKGTGVHTLISILIKKEYQQAFVADMKFKINNDIPLLLGELELYFEALSDPTKFKHNSPVDYLHRWFEKHIETSTTKTKYTDPVIPYYDMSQHGIFED